MIRLPFQRLSAALFIGTGSLIGCLTTPTAMAQNAFNWVAPDPLELGRVMQGSTVTGNGVIRKMPGSGNGSVAYTLSSLPTGITGSTSGSVSGNPTNQVRTANHAFTLAAVNAGSLTTGSKSYNVTIASPAGTDNPVLTINANVVGNRSLSFTSGTVDFGKVLTGVQTDTFTATLSGGSLDDQNATRVGVSVSSTTSQGVTFTNSSAFTFNGANQTKNLAVRGLFSTSGSLNSQANVAGLLSAADTLAAGSQNLSTPVNLAYVADVYEAASLTANDNGNLGDGDPLTVLNAAASGAQRAAARVTSLTLTPESDGWSLSTGLESGTVIQAGSTASATALFNSAGKLNGVHRANVTATFEHHDQTIRGTASGDRGSASWTLQETVSGNINHTGNARLLSGQGYQGFHLTRNGGHGTRAEFLSGQASQSRDLDVVFVNATANNGYTLVSDAVDITGTQGDLVVLQMSYDDTGVADETQVILGYLMNGQWVNAVLGNSDGGSQQQAFLGAYNGQLTLGNFGVDTLQNVAWAVIDHNSEFGVLFPLSVIPEPASLGVLLVTLASCVHRRRV